ncbi:hypothetical protein JI666_20815 [Bacillus sp. NTK071]|uniref:hypothetical protein n=1 Tax=Bacillus sp. NTK071 TaxID=2802175 RepID=UPI001A8E4E12|nr:hypothetical protein [Bacillus sp. NTK071]MBN8211165.1 hypothetical protein [Bacillus sp. NTK071]
MTKQEFLQRYKDENLNIGEYIIVLDNITDEPFVLGCVYDQGVWKIYESGERYGHGILKKKDNEEEAFDYFYQVVLSQHKLENS